MKRYSVQIHHYGSKVVQRGPMSGCQNFPKHYWTCIAEFSKKAEAIAAAAAQDTHAVALAHQVNKIFDNGKAPQSP